MAKTARRRMPRSSRAQARQARESATPAAAQQDEPPASTSSRSLAAGLAPTGRRRNPFGLLRRLEPRFVTDIIGELRKVTWPTLSETRYLTVVVAIVSLAVGLLLGGLDLLFGWVIERLFF